MSKVSSDEVAFFSPSGGRVASNSAMSFKGFVKMRIQSATNTLIYSYKNEYEDNVWISVTSLQLTQSQVDLFRSSRIQFKNTIANEYVTTNYTTLGSVNILPDSPNTGAFFAFF